MTDPVRESVFSRTRHALAVWLLGRPRDRTPLEVSLQDQVDELKARLDRSREEVTTLQSRLRVAQVEVESLAEVISRDRKRVEAETAAYARDIGRSAQVQ